MIESRLRPYAVIPSIAIFALTAGCTVQSTATQTEADGRLALTSTAPATPGQPTAVPSTSIAATGVPQDDYDGPGLTLLASGGQEQAGGLGIYCVASPVTGYCVDGPITLPAEPMDLRKSQDVVLRTTGDFDPLKLTLYVFEDGANITVNGDGDRVWTFDLARDAIDAIRKQALDPTTETTFDPQLEPGQYVLILNGLWSQGERTYDVTYGFTVSVSDS